MIVDRAKTGIADAICYNCNGKGHFSRNCPLPPTKRTQKIRAQTFVPKPVEAEIAKPTSAELELEIEKLTAKLAEADFQNGEN